MSFPRYTVALLTFALCVVSATSRTLPPVEAGSVIPLPSLPSRYLTMLHIPASMNADIQADTKKKPDGQGEITLPEGKGKDVTQRVCTGCHGINVFAQQRHTSEKWSSIIDTMISRGLEASDQDLATINDYLATNLAPPKDAPAK